MSGTAAVAAASSGPARPVRLTRRGRLVVTSSLVGLLAVAGSLGGVSHAAGASHPVRPRSVTVAPGETLWTLAARVAPQADPRLVVAQIERINHLRSAQLFPGQALLVPRAR